MKIAQVSPLYESVPPKFYGGTERIVSYLTEELVTMGHDVTLFASADSVTNAKLVPLSELGLRLDKNVIDPLSYHYYMLEKIVNMSRDFDIIHFHVDYLHFSFSRRAGYTNVTTLHGRLDIPEVIRLYEEFTELPLISISEAQRKPLVANNWLATVYHGIPLDLYRFNKTPEPYLAFLGRISPEKRVDRAIEIAKVSGMRLKIAAKIDPADEVYFNSVIKPMLLDTSSVEFIGEICDSEKQDLIGNASALIFPIDWPEPFGLVMIEAMACGTPVIAFPQGSVSEVIEHKRSGFIVENISEASEVIERLEQFDRQLCRGLFEKRFTSKRMAQDYIKSYSSLKAKTKTRNQNRPGKDQGDFVAELQ